MPLRRGRILRLPTSAAPPGPPPQRTILPVVVQVAAAEAAAEPGGPDAAARARALAAQRFTQDITAMAAIIGVGAVVVVVVTWRIARRRT